MISVSSWEEVTIVSYLVAPSNIFFCPRMENLAGHNQVLKASPAANIDPGTDLRADLDETLMLGASSNVGDYQVRRASPAPNVDPGVELSVGLSETLVLEDVGH